MMTTNVWLKQVWTKLTCDCVSVISTVTEGESNKFDTEGYIQSFPIWTPFPHTFVPREESSTLGIILDTGSKNKPPDTETGKTHRRLITKIGTHSGRK